MAFALTDYDGSSEPIEDPTYGALVAYYRSWGNLANSEQVFLGEFPTRLCRPEELHLNPDFTQYEVN